jgi:hypothetical protein
MFRRGEIVRVSLMIMAIGECDSLCLCMVGEA